MALLEVDPPYVVVMPGVSEEEFYALEGEDSDWEYVDGRLVMSPASDRHEDLFLWLGALLRGYLDSKGLGVVRGSRYPMRLDERWSPEPDLLVVRPEHRSRMTSKYLDGPADLVVEITSGADPRYELREKLPRYEQAGIPEIWVINPFERVLLARTLVAGEYREQRLSEGRLESSVLPGFWLEIEWLWQPELPPAFDCLRRLLA